MSNRPWLFWQARCGGVLDSLSSALNSKGAVERRRLEETPPQPSEAKPEPAETGAKAWVAQHPYPVGVTVAFALIGAVCRPLFYPEVSLWRSVIAGVFLGVFCTVCAIFPHFLD